MMSKHLRKNRPLSTMWKENSIWTNSKKVRNDMKNFSWERVALRNKRKCVGVCTDAAINSEWAGGSFLWSRTGYTGRHTWAWGGGGAGAEDKTLCSKLRIRKIPHVLCSPLTPKILDLLAHVCRTWHTVHSTMHISRFLLCIKFRRNFDPSE